MKNPYEILGVKKTASADEIKKAYRKKSKKTHPDKGGSNEEFTEVNKAYNILKDAIKRKIYDETGSTGEKTEQSIYNEVATMFFSAIAENKDAINMDIVSYLLDKINANMSESIANIDGLRKRINDISKFRGKMKLKDEFSSNDNIFEDLITGSIQTMEQEIRFWESFPEKLNKLKQIIEKYECDSKPTYSQFNFGKLKSVMFF